MRKCVLLFAALTPLLRGGSPAETITPRRLFSTVAVLGNATKKVMPMSSAQGKASVLVVFRTSEQGNVIDARAVAGPGDLRSSAVDAVRQWKFKPMLASGAPVQITSALVFDFSTNTPEATQANTMSARQLAPSLPAKCSLALQKQDPATLQICRQTLKVVDHADPSPMDLLSAEDEMGVALLRENGKAAEALEHINKAIALASQGLTPSDAEYADLYWHRALAEADSGNKEAAVKSYLTAEQSMNAAAQAIGVELAANYYRSLATKIADQRQQLSAH